MTAKFISTHPLASRRRFAAARRFLGWQISSRVRTSVEYEWIGGAKLQVRRGMTGATGNIYCGLHEFADMAFVMHFLRPGDSFIDVGANVGSYTVLASAVCGAATLAVEPDPDSADHLRDNISLNGLAAKVTLLQAALGAYEGQAGFSIGRDTCNHVANGLGPGSRKVRLTTLDTAAANMKPRLIKMDVEGYESHVIAGAANTLAGRDLLAVLSESDDPSVCEPLRDRGFLPYTYDAFSRRLEPAPKAVKTGVGNHLFVRDAAEVRQILMEAPRRVVVGVEF
jgi:FkbM family methyltransferase